MKKKIAILGSTGSIGQTTLDIIKENKSHYQIDLLTTNKNFNKIFLQAKKFKVKNLIIHNIKVFNDKQNFLRKMKINVYQNIFDFKKNYKSKLDYTMSSITGLNGLEPTLEIINSTKKIAIANKESIICGWNLIRKKLDRHKTKFVPIDSEHFSISQLLKNVSKDTIKKVYITASGGPFLKIEKKKLKNFSPRSAVKHPTWKMGKKISVDSSTLINKVFELIEAKKIFSLKYSQLNIIIQPTSYVHGIVDFSNGTSEILIHPTSMKIPIYNSIVSEKKFINFNSAININRMNNLNFQKIDDKKFPIKKILKEIPINDSLFETILVSANDTLVDLFLKQKVNFFQIYKILKKILTLKEYKKYKLIKPKNIRQIIDLSENVRLKTISLSVKSQR